jgi:hypothetical protein
MRIGAGIRVIFMLAIIYLGFFVIQRHFSVTSNCVYVTDVLGFECLFLGGTQND